MLVHIDLHGQAVHRDSLEVHMVGSGCTASGAVVEDSIFWQFGGETQHVLVVSSNLLRLVPDGGDGEMWCKDREGIDADGVAWSPLVHGRIPKEGLLFVFEALGAEETLAMGECLVGDVSHDRMYAPGVEEEEGRKIAYREFFAFDQAKQIILKSSTTAECELVVVHAFYLLGE